LTAPAPSASNTTPGVLSEPLPAPGPSSQSPASGQITPPATGGGPPAAGPGSGPQSGSTASLDNDVPTAPDKDLTLNTAILGALNKITAQVATVVAPVGTPVHFGTLEIIARACRKHPPEETPESAAFLDIWELRPGHAAKSAFRGWMFASSPAISAMEDPVYDIWVRDCRNTAAGDNPS
jgi:hypothetical protein